jgi:hypothetical protein
LADFPVGGAQSYIQAGKESTYGTEASAITVAFGHNQSITPDESMNETPVYGLGSPYASKTFAGLFEGKLAINFDLASTYFLELVMGNCNDGGTDPKTHTYVDNTGYAATSFTVEDGSDLDQDIVNKYLGCVVDSCEMVFRVGEPTVVTINALYGKMTKANTGIDTTPATDAEELLIFSEASWQMPSGTTLARVQGGTLRFIKNAQLIYGLGSRIAAKAIWKQMIFEWDLEIAFENDDLLEQFYGQATGPLTATNPAGAASLVLTWTNGGTTTAQRSLVITLTTSQIVSMSIPKKVEELTIQNIKGFSIAKTSIVGSDNTAACPY